MTKFRRELGMRIYQAREKVGATQRELGAAIHRSHHAISSWEQGRRGVDAETLSRLSRALGVSVGWLVGEVRG